MNLMKALFAALLLISLTACGSQPNDEDLRAAMTENLKAMGAGSQFKEEIAKIKILSCKKSESREYLCHIKGVMDMNQTVRMIKTDNDGWQLIMAGANAQ